MKAVTVEIKAEGWAGYTGPLGGFRFVDGKSVEPIPLRRALRIGATLTAVDAETGESLHPAVYNLDYSPSSVEAKTETIPVSTQVESPVVPEVKAETVESQTPAIDLTPTQVVQGDGSIKAIYSRAQLEAIADRSGIAGLREISDSLGIKGRAVAELIERIVEAQ